MAISAAKRRVHEAPDALDRTGRPQQIGEQGPNARRGVAVAARGQLQVASVAVDVLPEQRDLRDAGRGKLADLGDDLVERA